MAIYDEHPRGARSNEPTARFGLAQVIAETGGDIERARNEAKKARAFHAELGEERAAMIREIDAWLEAHPEAPRK